MLLLCLAGQTFKTSVDAVRVDVLVTQDSVPVTGLTVSDFELRDNGVVQQIGAFTTEQVPLDVTLVLDVSASVAGLALEHLKDAATALVGLLDPIDRGALMTFSGSVRREAGWTADVQTLRQAIAASKASGGTALHDAAYAALMHRDASTSRSLVLIFSDGADTNSWLPGQTVIDLAGRAEAVVYAVALQPNYPRHFGYLVDVQSGIQAPLPRAIPSMMLTKPFLSTLTTETGGTLLQVTDSRDLRETFLRVMREFRSRYVLTYTPRGVSERGWHTLRVDVRQRGATVSSRRGYFR